MAPRPVVRRRQQVLLELREVGSWYRDHASAATARTQLDQLELFSRRVGKEPLELLRLAKKDPRTLRDLVQGYINDQQTAGRSSRYALNTWWGVRSFLAYHEVAPSWTPKLKPVADDDTTETVPSVEQLRGILNVLSDRGRAAALLMATSGIRVGVLAVQDGPSDGLRLKHLPELQLDPEPHFTKAPFLVRVPAHLAKGSTVSKPRGYLTFGNAEAAEAIVAYLRTRIKGGEELTPESPLMTGDGAGPPQSHRRSKDGARVMARKSLALTIRRAMAKVAPEGAHWHTHTLRAWFSTQMEAAEARGLVSRSRREFFMGHAGRGVDFDYNLDRPMSKEKLDDLRESYKRCESYLAVSPGRPESEIQAKMTKAMLIGLGYTEADLGGLDLANLDASGFQDLVSAGPILRNRTSPTPSRPKQKMVKADELPGYLDQGWTVVTALQGDRVVITAPAS